ncbi:uncharacterized protein LOC126903847 [Daktulosphaira vitifoliae]|uniref:uncharacterized protein LOC126903847 n=1 Tax=Daktulosphaira vitifoliae TaxID=58002 RepID=UPI0021AAF1A7|nr:uncharacterized protein LOC126903847 [Daktulosphaira vitifoliae]
MDTYRKLKKLILKGIKNEYNENGFGNSVLKDEKFVSVEASTEKHQNSKSKSYGQKFVLRTFGVLVGYKRKNLSNNDQHENFIALSSGDLSYKKDKVLGLKDYKKDSIKSIMELNPSCFLKIPTLLLGSGNYLALNIASFSSFSQTEECYQEKVPSKVFEELISPRLVLKLLKNEKDITLKHGITNSLLKAQHRYSCDVMVSEKTRSSPYNIYKKFPLKDISPTVFKRTPSSKLGKLIEKFDKFFKDNSINLPTNSTHNSTTLKKQFALEVQCDKETTSLYTQPNHEVDLQPLINIRNKPNTILKTEHGYSGNKIVLEKTKTSPYDVYRKFPFRDISVAVFKRTPSPRLGKLIENFDKFFNAKCQDFSLNTTQNIIDVEKN